MSLFFERAVRLFALLFLLPPFLSSPALANPPGTLRGQVFDPLGGVVPNAKVTLIENGQTIGSTTTDTKAILNFSFPRLAVIAFMSKPLGEQHAAFVGFPATVGERRGSQLGRGAAVNSESYRARGDDVEADLGHGLLVGGNYTYQDPVATQTFASTPLFHPTFPGIPIGAISPLVGNRPFRLSPNSGSLFIDYSRRRFGVTATGYLGSRSDDSTFLTDQFGGTAVALFASAENVLNEHYTAAFGFPSLPFAIRGGTRITIGGEGWRPR